MKKLSRKINSGTSLKSILPWKIHFVQGRKSRQTNIIQNPCTVKAKRDEKIVHTNPAIFLIIAGGFEFNPLTNATISCFNIDNLLSLSESTTMTSALKASPPKA